MSGGGMTVTEIVVTERGSRMVRGGVGPGPARQPAKVARVGCYRADNTLVEGSEVEVTLRAGARRGERSVRLPEGYVLPEEGVYLRVDVEGEGPMVFPLPTTAGEREYVARMWARDWGSAEDAVYDGGGSGL